MTRNISLFTFCVICSIFKCDGFTGLKIISIKYCGIKFITSSLRDTKITSKNSYLNEGWLFIYRFKVGSLPRMKNKEVLAQFTYQPT